MTISVVFPLLTLRSKRASDRQVVYAQFQSSLNYLMEISNEIQINGHDPEENKNKLIYTEKMNGLQLKKATIAERAHKLAQKSKKLISHTEFSELAKTFYSLREYEKAEKYHLQAIRNASDSLGEAAKRSYADFLFLTERIQEGRDQYKKCIIDQTTDRNKSINVKTLQMWMYNEAMIGNQDARNTIYNEACSIIERIGDLRTKELRQELENVRNSL